MRFVNGVQSVTVYHYSNVWHPDNAYYPQWQRIMAQGEAAMICLGHTPVYQLTNLRDYGMALYCTNCKKIAAVEREGFDTDTDTVRFKLVGSAISQPCGGV